ncbi:hypothetical protein ACFBZI_08435 [Moraxella sp. ZJ142]|uniref:hypothetical protein n=1 Tax=Moraxella marmotae TaxID=3344520 RepID=UPI0035D505BE
MLQLCPQSDHEYSLESRTGEIYLQYAERLAEHDDYPYVCIRFKFDHDGDWHDEDGIRYYHSRYAEVTDHHLVEIYDGNAFISSLPKHITQAFKPFINQWLLSELNNMEMVA